jgi:16S rRNA (cytosine1402-N4)-methyltransferase
LLEQAPECQVLGLDLDRQALEEAERRLAPFGGRVHLRQLSFSRFQQAMDQLGWKTLDGALLDLGVSSMQLDRPERGFSFLHDGPLDMRLDPGMGRAPASSLLNKASLERLRRIIREFGEEPMAGRIAKEIVRVRNQGPLQGTLQLARLVERAYPAKRRAKSRNHPATKTFQALRIAVNRELQELEEFLSRIPGRLTSGGRLAVISFHSLEDRIVKRFLRSQAQDQGPRLGPDRPSLGPRLKALTKKPLQPTAEETAANPRSRSAKLRIAERVG